MSSSLVSLREAIRAGIATKVGDFAEVATHGGRVDLAEIKRWATRSPSARVGLLRVPRVELEGGALKADLAWGCFIIAADKPQLPRDMGALLLLQSVLSAVRPEERWGDTEVSAVREVSAENLYSGSLDGVGVALWAVAWRSYYDLATLDLTTLDDFITFDAQWSMGGAQTPKAEDTVTLPTA